MAKDATNVAKTHQEAEMRDAGTERALLGSVLKYGKDGLIEVQDILEPQDFGVALNKHLYESIITLSENKSVDSFDIPSIQAQMKMLGHKDLETSTNLQYLVDITVGAFELQNMRPFAKTIRQWSIYRKLHKKHLDLANHLELLDCTENLGEVVAYSEREISAVSLLGNQTEDYVQIGKDTRKILTKLKENPVKQVGLSTGYSLYDEAIGGGLRRGSVSVIGARSKVGKSFLGLNMAVNISSTGIPCMLVDTELTYFNQTLRGYSIYSGTPLNDVETGNISDESFSTKLKQYEALPLVYRNVSGVSLDEIVAIMRRFLVKNVGYQKDGLAKPCVIIYDYLKTQNATDISKNIAEFQRIGFMMSTLHDFSVTNGIPIVCFVQLNRDGIDVENSSTIAMSDRIVQLCSSFAILKNKDVSDCALSNESFGNKKLVIVETRFGGALETGDFINLQCSLRPNISKAEATGKIIENGLASSVRQYGERKEYE